ncbi:hypothetical protein Q4591_07070 [Shewanella sp. 3_MG-2023]|uniref:hypothetical protein n=1 Tax=Shewanella sp. 3_MG-2023 TaxID=3062635 RepID=UPI0026E3AC56|nr:hypothetical protein [Shewanella sp. 3_MG-2023]MDO6775111.1 hypothetical protein [Shewanella sp. 3_MG-2023]
MDTSQLYLVDFPEELKIKDLDIVSLYHQNRFEELDAVIVCRDSNGDITATFEEDTWKLMPFARRKIKTSFNFSEFKHSPRLMNELKLVTYGRLFNKNPQGRKASSFSAIESELSKNKIAYRFLLENNYTSLSQLSNPKTWEAFEEYLINKSYAQRTLEGMFVAINNILKLSGWHHLKLGFNPIKQELSSKLSDKKLQQTLVIPERLSDAIYGQAIKLVNAALPHKESIAETEKALQDNYLEGKRTLDEKLKNGSTFTFLGESKNIVDHRKYVIAIADNQPQTLSDIIAPLARKIENTELNNGNDFHRYLGQLITSCYIICGGFSGMRDSELDKLTPNSYYKDTFEGRDYHMLQSHTFKLGEKRETWVVAPAAQQAIELITAITKYWRKEVRYPDTKYNNTVWVNQPYRSKIPRLINYWNKRLQLFCKQFDFVVTQEDYQECLNSNSASSNKIKETVKVGEPWPMATHQFRRSLAFYCIKNRLGTAIALKQQFKHLYLSMTEWYTNGGKLASIRGLRVDDKIQKALNIVNAETVANKIFNQWHSDIQLSGSHGKTIMKMRDDVPQIYSSWDVIYQAIKDGRLTLHSTAHSYCKAGYDCDMDGIITPQFCVDCSSGSSIIDDKQAIWWQKKHKSLVAYIALGDDISVTDRSHFITQIRAAENVMSDFDMPFTPFEAELKVTEL